MAEHDDSPSEEFRELGWALGYRFGSEGSIWSRWYLGGTGRLGSNWRRRKLTLTDGYLTIRLTVGDRKKTYRVNRLICEAFHGPCPPGMECCHDPDHTPTNNRANNLRWDTSKANKADAERHGRRAKGARNGRAKLTEYDIPTIRNMITDGISMTRIAELYKVDPAVIRRIASRKLWSHVTG
jgi:hypothetical protein